MSCVHFNTKAMRDQLLLAVADDQPVAQFLSPQITEGKVKRIERLAEDANHKIRESAALSYHASRGVFEKLAGDKVDSVRECVARNPMTPKDILEALTDDPAQSVRAFVAFNRWGADRAVEILAR
jgi:hypothetical protein